MDSQVVNQKALEFSNRVLRMSPGIFERFALAKNQIVLQVEEFRISCVPFDLSLSGARLLAFLSPREVEFFSQFTAKKQRLTLVFQNRDRQKDEAFHLNVDIKSMVKPDATSPYCMVDTSFQTCPFYLKEKLVQYFDALDRGKALFDSTQTQHLPPDQFEKLLGGKLFRTLGDSMAQGSGLRLCTLSNHTASLFGEFDRPPAIGMVLDLESMGKLPLGFRGTVETCEALPQVPDCLLVQLKLEFQASLFEAMAAWKPPRGRQNQG